MLLTVHRFPGFQEGEPKWSEVCNCPEIIQYLIEYIGSKHLAKVGIISRHQSGREHRLKGNSTLIYFTMYLN